MRGVRTAEGDIGCDRVVVATGAWGRELLRPVGVDVPIALKRVQVAVLRQPAGAPRPNVVCSDAVSNVVVRPDRGALFCAVTYFGDEPLDAADDCEHDASAGYEEAIRRSLAERYPALAGAAWQRAWAGAYDYSPDWNPIIGEAPGVDGPAPRARLERARLQALAGGRRGRGRRGARSRAAHRRLGPAAGALRRGPAAAARLRPRRAGLTAAHDEKSAVASETASCPS